MAWSMVQGVLWAFRRRLTVPQVADFANLLPPLLRSLFIEGWDPAAPVATFASREALTREVRQVRPQHNFAPDHSIRAVAIALRASVDESKLEVLLSKLPPEARAFWWPGER